jgi:hypothetical protein
MKKSIIIIFLVFTVSIYAQEKDSTLNKWNPSLATGFNISQIAFSNWVKGGDNSLTWTLTGDFALDYKSSTWTFAGKVKAAYGRTKLGGESFRTNDNDLYIDKVLSYNIGWEVEPFFSNSIRTQISSGYNYDVTPAAKIADFFDPGYVTQSIGFTYNKKDIFKSRLGIALQETFTNKFRQYSDDPDTPELEAFKLETGIESVSDAQFTLDDNLLLKSTLRLFSSFSQLDVWDVRWDNLITAKINSWLNVNLTYLLIYEKAQSPKTQMKEALQLGVVYTIF